MRSETLKSILGLSLILLVSFVLQSAVLSPLHAHGCAPLLLPLFAVGAGLLGNAAWGGAFGLVAGILCDVSLGSQGLPFTVGLTAMGFFAGFLGDFVLTRGFVGYLVTGVLALAISAGLEIFPLLFLHASGHDLLMTALKQTGVSLLFCLPMYLCLRRALRSWLRARRKGLTERKSRET